MKEARKPENEEKRLEALKFYEVLDTIPEQNFDDLTLIASQICGTPIALVSLIDETRQWFKSKVGLGADETPREFAFCAHAILEDGIFEVPDSSKDDRFKDNPLATGAPHVRFYAGAPLKTPQGYNIGTLCVIDHIPRHLCDKQRQSLEALARQVVTQLELKASYKRAEDSSVAKSMFLANMSHEIRTPLGGILSFTELILDMNLPQEAVEQISYIKECSENLLTIVNDILDISKIEANKIEINNSAFSLKEVAQKSCSLFKEIAKEKNIELNFNFDDELPKYIYSDVVRLRQILINLVGNAVKFTSKGSVQVKVKQAAFEEGKEPFFIVEVQDTGIGVSKNDRERIFETFEQADKTTTRNFGGTGLGLPICSQLTSLMGGKIEVESDLEKGSLFRVVLPLVKAEALSEEKDENKSVFEDIKSIEKIKILAAEDNLINQKVLVRILAKLGLEEVDVVSNGQECIELAEKNDYDLILMDVQMPVVDGLEATRIIKKSRSVHIVGLSANAFDEDRKQAKESGMDDYLEKPINFSKLKLLLSQLGRGNY